MRVAIGADISGLIDGMNRAQGAVKRGADTISKSAKASAKVFEDAKRQADALLGSVDPLYAAQVRYDKELSKAQQLMKAGALTAGEMTRIQAGLKAQLDSTAKSYGNVAAANGRARMGFTQLSFQVGDIAQGLAMGTRASTIFAQQSGQVIQSLQIMGGQGNAFLRFLGGPWGIALSTAAVVLTPFIGKLFQTRDELKNLVDKMRDEARQAALNEQADAIWKRTIDGLTDSIRKRREEQEKSLQTDIQAEQESLNNARQELADAQSKQTAVARQLREAMANLQKLRESPAGLTEEDDRSRSAAILRAQARVDALTAQLQKLNAGVSNAEANIRGAQAPILERDVAGKLDAVQAATDEYTRTLGTLRDALQAGSISQKQFEDRLTAAKKKLDAVKDAAKDAGKEFGRQIDFAQAAQIAHSAGLQVNSSYRSPAQQAALYNNPAVNRPGNPVAPPGASAHNGANGKWAIDIQITDGITPAKIRSIYAQQGVSLTKILKENGHFHIEGSRSEAAKAENDADRAAQTSVRQQNDFDAAKDNLNRQILQARGALAKGIEAQAKAAEAQVFDDEKRQADAIKADLAEGRYGDATSEAAKARAAQLLGLNHALAVQRLTNIIADKQQALDEAAFRLRDQQMSLEIEALRNQDEIATTADEHRKAQLAILDAVYAQKRLELEHEKQLAARNGASDDEIAAIQGKIDALGQQQAADETRTRNGTMGPLEQWARSIPKSAAEINEALQSIEVQGLDGLSDAIAEVITGTKSLKQAFADLAQSIIADIIRMTVRMLIFRAISGIMGGGKLGAGVDGSSFGAFETSSGGGGFGIPGFANGGGFTILGRRGVDKNMLSLNGLPIANVSYGERLSVGNDNGPVGGNVTIHQHYSFSGVAVTKDEFVQGLMYAKHDTIATIRDMRRRGRG